MKILLRRGWIGVLLAGAALGLIAACTPPGVAEFPVPDCAAAGTCPQNPCEASEAVMAEGEQIYLTTCATCHGYATDGFGPQYQLYSPRPASFKTDAFQAQNDGVIFMKAWHGNTNVTGDDVGDLPHSLPQQLGTMHTEFKVNADVRGNLREQCAIDGAARPTDTGGMTEEELWKVVRFLRTAPTR